MQHALFALIQARIKQPALDRHLNLLSISADICTRCTAVGAGGSAVFRRLTAPFRPAACFRGVLT